MGQAHEDWVVALTKACQWRPEQLHHLSSVDSAPGRARVVNRAIEAFLAKGYPVTVLGTHAAVLEHDRPELLEAGVQATTGEGSEVASMICHLLRLIQYVTEEPAPGEPVVPQLVVLDEWNAAAAAIHRFDPDLDRAFVGLVSLLISRGCTKGVHVMIGSATALSCRSGQ